MAAPKASAMRQATAILMPAAWSRATTTPESPATAATERSRPPAMISGVCSAHIKPMKAILAPMLIILSKDRNQGESVLKSMATKR